MCCQCGRHREVHLLLLYEPTSELLLECPDFEGSLFQSYADRALSSVRRVLQP
jgi:hypothetical protein